LTNVHKIYSGCRDDVISIEKILGLEAIYTIK